MTPLIMRIFKKKFMRKMTKTCFFSKINLVIARKSRKPTNLIYIG